MWAEAAGQDREAVAECVELPAERVPHGQRGAHVQVAAQGGVDPAKHVFFEGKSQGTDPDDHDQGDHQRGDRKGGAPDRATHIRRAERAGIAIQDGGKRARQAFQGDDHQGDGQGGAQQDGQDRGAACLETQTLAPLQAVHPRPTQAEQKQAAQPDGGAGAPQTAAMSPQGFQRCDARRLQRGEERGSHRHPHADHHALRHSLPGQADHVFLHADHRSHKYDQATRQEQPHPQSKRRTCHRKHDRLRQHHTQHLEAAHPDGA